MKNKLKLLTIGLAAMFFYKAACFAETITTSDFKVIETKVLNADENTLVIFDVDDVLLHPKDQILKIHNKPYSEEIYKQIEARYTQADAQELYSYSLLQRQNGPVDKRMITLINQAQNKGIPVIALTNCLTGAFGKIASLEDWRIQELKRIGYHFDKAWKNFKEKSFNEIQPKEPNRFPVFKQGAIFTANTPKGDTLKAFLNYTEQKPKKIIFIDDKKKYLESVEAFAQGVGIEFLGIEYTAVKESKIEPLNKERANLQFEILEKEHKWLSDEEADARIRKGKNDHNRPS